MEYLYFVRITESNFRGFMSEALLPVACVYITHVAYFLPEIILSQSFPVISETKDTYFTTETCN